MQSSSMLVKTRKYYYNKRYINILLTQHNWMNISAIIWKMFQSKPHHMDYCSGKS